MGNPIVLNGQENFKVQPDDIDASTRHLWNAFDHSETETSAGWIIRFLQERGLGWAPFSHNEIEAYYSKSGKFTGFSFNRLINPEMVPPSLARAFAGYYDKRIPKGGGWIIKGDDDKYYVTVEFVTRCFSSSPKMTQAQPAETSA